MHSQFADWYRLASVDFNDIDLKARWAGVAAAVNDFSSEDLLNAARVFYGIPAKATDFLDRFRDSFKKADDKFLMLGNEAEVRVLCGAALVALFDMSPEWSNAAALAAACPSFRGARPSAVGDIERLARETLASRSASLRNLNKLPQLGQDFITSAGKQVTELLATIKPNTALNAAHDQFDKVLRDMVAGFTIVDEWTRAEQHQQALRTEESNVLWWLIGGYSRDLEVAFAKIKVPALVMIAGKELADLTSIIPGAYSARAFLDKVIRENFTKNTVTLADSVNACPPEWRKSVATQVEIQDVEDLCPTLFAVHKADEAAGKKAWMKVFEGVTAIKLAQQMNPVDLAEQAFQECLLARAIAGINEE